MNPWLLLVTILGWLVVVIVSLAIGLFMVVFFTALWTTWRESVVPRPKRPRRTPILVTEQTAPKPTVVTIRHRMGRQR